MRPRVTRYEAVAAGIGSAAGLSLIVGALLTFPGPPLIIAPNGSSLDVPSFYQVQCPMGENVSANPVCGYDGILILNFTTSAQYSLTGSLASGKGFLIGLKEVGGYLPCTTVGIPCPPIANSIPSYFEFNPLTAVSLNDLGALIPGMPASFPAGNWQLVILNPNLGPLTVDVASAVTASPL